MDDDRWAARRLLSFDASQPWTRFGKVFSQRSGRSPAEVSPDWFTTNRAGHHEAPGPILAMAASSDKRLAATLGSSWMEIVELQPGSAQSSVKSLNFDPKFLPTTLQWGQLSTKNSIAVASNSGTIQLYAYSGQVIIHSRSSSPSPMNSTISSLSFSSMANGNILASSSNDGNVRLWDLRQGLRRPASKFARNGDITREVQFRPDHETKFAAIYDSGIVQLWDIRKPSACDMRLNAHMQGLTLDWHPTSNHLATGGRDHLVHVWNIRTDSKVPEYTVNTASAVGRVRWMPGDSTVNNNAIITAQRSAADSNHRSTNYWLLNRPWAPIYSLETHSDSICDIAAVSPTVLWSASKDGLLMQHDLRYEPLVYDNFPPTLGVWSGPHSTLICSQSKPELNVAPSTTPDTEYIEDYKPKYPASGSTQSPSGSLPGSVTPTGGYFGSLGSSAGSNFSAGGTTLSRPEQNLAAMLDKVCLDLKPNPLVEIDFFAEAHIHLDTIGEMYLFDAPLNWSWGDTCRHNAKSAAQSLRTRHMWNILAAAIDDAQQTFLGQQSGRTKEIAEQWFSGASMSTYAEPLVSDAPTKTAHAMSASTASESRDQSVSYESHQMYDWNIGNDQSHTWQFSGVSFASDMSGNSDDEQRRRKSKERRPSTLLHNMSSTRNHLPTLGVEGHYSDVKHQFVQFLRARDEQWHFLALLETFSKHAIEDGLLFTAVTLQLIFREFSWVFPPASVEAIISCIQMLRASQQYVAAANIMNISSAWQDHMGIPETTVDTVCSHCDASLSESTAAFFAKDRGTGYWYCARCKQMQSGCSLCNIPVKGLGIVVLGCGHKAHPRCWQEWVAMNIKDCPAGCGQSL